MTDDELVKALTICTGEDDGKGCAGCPLEDELVCNSTRAEAALDCINRLRAENAEAKALCKKKFGDLSLTQWLRLMVLAGYDVEAQSQAEHDREVRKEGIKEVLQLWYNECMAHLRPEEAKSVVLLAEDYGVTLKE